jgi:hypothetical protein
VTVEVLTALMTAKPRRRMTPTYGSWRNMLGRCENPLTNGYKYYGGRGITVCVYFGACSFLVTTP